MVERIPQNPDKVVLDVLKSNEETIAGLVMQFYANPQISENNDSKSEEFIIPSDLKMNFVGLSSKKSRKNDSSTSSCN